jgi:hypothetical protein
MRQVLMRLTSSPMQQRTSCIHQTNPLLQKEDLLESARFVELPLLLRNKSHRQFLDSEWVRVDLKWTLDDTSCP